MSSAFTLTLAYLAEQCSAKDSASAFAAYITGNVASNLFGRLMSGTVTDMLGLAPNFYLFACLNLAGAALVYVSLNRCSAAAPGGSAGSSLGAWRAHFRNPALRSAFAIGFIILFAFIGVFTYVNFVLAKAPIGLSPMALGLVYLVFIPSILTTPFAGRVVQHVGPRLAFWVSLGVAGVGLALLVLPSLIPMLIGLALVGAGTFFAQAAATGFVGHAATCDRGSASGIYLGSYYCGGLAGSALVGQVFDRFGWTASVTLIGASLALAALLAVRMKIE
jgi:predicted MFS family arabinose efflux permease